MLAEKNTFIINKTYDSSIFRTIIRRYWWWPALFMALLFLCAFFYLRYTKSTFESNLVLQISNEDNGKAVLDLENLGSSKDDYYSQIELVRSELLFEKAIEALNLNVSLFSRGEILTEEKYHSSSFNVLPYALFDSTLVDTEILVQHVGGKIKLTYWVNGKEKRATGQLNDHFITNEFDVVIKSVDPKLFYEELEINELFFKFNSIESLSARMLSGLIVEPLDEAAQTIRIGYRGHNPQLCKDIAQSVAQSYISYSDELKKKGSENVLTFIDIQLDSLSKELKKSKDSLMDYQRNENLPDPEGVGVSLKENVDKLKEDLFLLDYETSTLRSVSATLSESESPNRLEVYRLLPELIGTSFEESIANHIEALHQMMEEKEDLLFRMTKESTEIKRIDKKIQEKIKLILRSINAIESRLSARSSLIRSKLNGLEEDYGELPGKRMEFGRLKNIQDLNEKYFQLLTEKKVLYSISDAGYASNNRVLTKAELSMVPVAPSRKLIYGSFLAFGLIVGLGVMFLKYISFNEINRLEDLEAILPSKATILGGIPLFQYSLEYSQLIVTDSPKSIMAEAMRKIRVNLNYIKPNFKTIAISSSISGEGKTFVALNLAGIISMSGKKTILIDLDLRKPKVHLGFGVQNTHGMSNLIIGETTLEQAIHKNVAENLDFITAGPIPPNPSELLLSNRFNEIIAELKIRYDVIVIDNPPIGLVSDGVKLLTDADIPIYVFKSHYSQRNFANRVKELFEMQQLTSLNVILNGIESTKNSIYGYGYGSGYVEDEDQSKYLSKNRFKNFLRKLFRKNGN